MRDEWKEAEKSWKEAAAAWRRVPHAMLDGIVIGAAIGTIAGFVIIAIMYLTHWHP